MMTWRRIHVVLSSNNICCENINEAQTLYWKINVKVFILVFFIQTITEASQLTVLGLVRFLASVSQLLRWLYVLRLQIKKTNSVILVPCKNNIWHHSQINHAIRAEYWSTWWCHTPWGPQRLLCSSCVWRRGTSPDLQCPKSEASPSARSLQLSVCQTQHRLYEDSQP